MTLPPRARQSSVSDEAASTAVSLAAIDWDVALVDKDVRRLLDVLQDDGVEGKTYAGRSNSTVEGKAFLQNQVDGLMREKAQFKEKRMVLMQRQQELQGGGGGGVGRGSSASVANSSSAGLPKATPPSLPQTPTNDNSTHSTSRRGSFPLGPRPSPAPGSLRAPSPAKSATEAEDRRAVAETTVLWKDTVTSGTYDAPKKTAALYAPDGTLWGTVSEEVRDTPQQIYAYFDYFARLPELRVVEYTPVAVRVYGDFAVQAGTYTFSWQADDGATVEKRARFSFTFRRDNPGTERPWTIVEHHSSSMPTAPAGLKAVGAGPGIPRGPKVVKETTPDQKAVAATAVVWKDTVTMGTDDTPRKTADLYAQDATLWGTVSEEVRDTPEQIYAYFDYFARLPALRLVEYTPVAVRVYGDFAVQAGTYTFSWQDNDGVTVEKRARFSFTFRRDPNTPQQWAIVEHHSSSMPTAPAGLKPAISGTNLADLTHDTGKATATTAPASSATQSASGASARDEDAAPNEAGGAGAAAAAAAGSAGATTTAAAAAAAAAAGVDYMRFPVTEEGEDEGASATAPSDSIFKMLPRTACTAACGAAVAAAIVGFVAAVLMAPALSSTDLEAAPIGKVAVVNVAAAVAAAVATGLAPVGGALSRM